MGVPAWPPVLQAVIALRSPSSCIFQAGIAWVPGLLSFRLWLLIGVQKSLYPLGWDCYYESLGLLSFRLACYMRSPRFLYSCGITIRSPWPSVLQALHAFRTPWVFVLQALIVMIMSPWPSVLQAVQVCMLLGLPWPFFLSVCDCSESS